MSGPEAKAPPLRFMSSLGPWERKRFGEFATLRRGLTYTPADCREKGVRVLRSSNISEETFVLHSDDVFVSEQAANIPFVRNGDILITAANGSSHLVGKHALIDGVGEKDTVHGGFMLLAESDLPEFLDAAMSAPWYKQFVADYMMGGNGALGNLAKSSFDECTFLAPSTQYEQRHIGSFFRSLDALIAGREKALEKLEALKKSMLLKMFPQGDATVPEVRFKGFVGDCEKKRLGDSFNLDVSTNTLSRAELSQTGMVRNVHYGDVLIKYGSIVDVSNEAIPFIADCQFKCDRKNKLMDGDVIMADTAEDETAGKVAEIRGIGDELLVSGLHTIVLRPNEKYGDGFLGYCLNAPGYHESLSSVMQGSKVLSINKGVLSDTDFLAPSLPEQQKIGAYFRSLDALLAARREEIGKLKQMKKALLERMFV